VAISFLGDPEDALFVAMNLMQTLASDPSAQPTAVRAGINLGPVRLVRDINSQPNIIGDGINVAQRVMSFAQPRQVLVSRSYYDVVTRISEDYGRLFAYQGSRTDKHVREHELYELVAPGSEAHEITRKRSHDRRLGEEIPGEETLSSATQSSAPLLRNPRVAFAFTGFSVLALSAAALYYVVSRPGSEEQPAAGTTTAPARSIAAAPAQPVTAAPEPGEPPAEPPAPFQEATQAALPPRPARAPYTAPARPAAKPVPEPSAPVDEPRSPFAVAPNEAAAEARPEAVQPWKSAAPPASAQPAPRAEGVASALVQLAISPWGEVYVNGKTAGVSPPMTELELRPGRYRIEVRNGEFKPYQDEVELASNQTIRIKHKFIQPR
jgi:hypothetical protein